MDAGGSGGRVTRVALANSPRYSWRSRRFDHDVSVPSARLRQSVARRTRSLPPPHVTHDVDRSEEHTSELQSLMRISYAVFCLKKKNKPNTTNNNTRTPRCSKHSEAT